MTATQQSQLIIEAAGDFLSGKDTHPCRGQLDSQRDAVHPANDGLDRSSDILAQLEPWLRVTGSIGEKPGRIRRPCFTGIAALLHRQRGHWPYQLPRDVKRRTAGGQNRHRWTLAQQHLGHPPGRIQHVLAAVQHHQRGCLAQVLHRRLQRRAAWIRRPPIRAQRRRPHLDVGIAGPGHLGDRLLRRGIDARHVPTCRGLTKVAVDEQPVTWRRMWSDDSGAGAYSQTMLVRLSTLIRGRSPPNARTGCCRAWRTG